jgi:hypothetical protein
MPTTAPTTIQDDALIAGVLDRLAAELATMMGHELALSAPKVERATTRPAGKGQVHISFKLGLVRDGGAKSHGALLVPLPDAITMAGFLLMMPEESVPGLRAQTELEPAIKDAMLELGNLVASAGQSALIDLGALGWSLVSEGCQGVRADVRPAFPYREGEPLIVGRAQARLEEFTAFELIVVLPPLE